MSGRASQAAPVRATRAFRLRLLLAMMLVISAIAALALFVAQRNADDAYQQRLQEQFQGRFRDLLGIQEARLATATERCRGLARSVRIRAALAENDLEDLYENARIELELRDVLVKKDAAGSPGRSRSLQANFFRLLNAEGVVLQPEAPGASPKEEADRQVTETPSDQATETAPWEKELSAAASASDEQQVGYFLIPEEKGAAAPKEIIATPLINSATGERLGTLVLGFDSLSAEHRAENQEVDSGVWFESHLHLPNLSPATRASLSRALDESLKAGAAAEGRIMVHAGGEPYWLFYKILNAGSHFAPAYQVCVYPLGRDLAMQRRLQFQIVGAGCLVLLVGLGASHILSTRFAKPVEQLAEDSAGHLAMREKAEAALELTEQKYRSIFENAVEGIFLQSLDGRFLSANPAMARIFGYESPVHFVQEAATRSFYAEPEFATEFIRSVSQDGVVSNFECEVVRRDGQRIWVSQNARAIPDASGALHHLEGTLEDITERKQTANALVALNVELEKAVADLRTTQQQVIQQERLRALGEMASGIAHDFNNALTPIIGFSELLLVRPEILQDRKRAVNYLDVIHTGAKDASHIVGRLREFYRSNEKGDVFVAVDVQKLVEQVIALTQPKWKDQAQSSGAEIAIRTELQPTVPACGDESALREVLTNLIFNAVDAMPKGGTLTLRCRQETNRAVIEVSDSGTGMTPEVRERCLEPFFSTKGERGTGLGLAMVFGILQRHSGSVDIESELGRGTTFFVRLPLHQAGPSAQTNSEPARGQKSLRVLLVDDEPQVRDVLAAFLTADGHIVEMASNGLEGIRTFRTHPFEVVVTDKAMPGMSGDQMALAIKQLAPRTPIILLTGFSQFLEGDSIPGIDVLATKPITMPNLREAIRKAVQAA